MKTGVAVESETPPSGGRTPKPRLPPEGGVPGVLLADLTPGFPSARGLLDRTKPRHYHGGDLAGIHDRMSCLRELGVTALWTTPRYDNVNHLNRLEKDTADNRRSADGEPSTDYHGYGAVNLYGVEGRFGDLSQLRGLVNAAHATDLKVIQDQVATLDEESVHAHVKRLLQLRQVLSPLRRGDFVELAADANRYVFARVTPEASVVMAFNNSEQPLTFELVLGRVNLAAAKSLTDRLGKLGTVLVTEGKVKLTLAARSAVVLKP